MRIHPRPLDRFCALYCSVFFMEKKLTMSQFTTDAIFRCDLYARCRHRRLLKTTHNCAQLNTTTHNYAQLIKLVFMVLGVSYSRVLLTEPGPITQNHFNYNYNYFEISTSITITITPPSSYAQLQLQLHHVHFNYNYNYNYSSIFT